MAGGPPLFPFKPVPLDDSVLILLRYDSVQLHDTDSYLNPKVGYTEEKNINVTGNGIAPGAYWSMVSCRANDPLSWDPYKALQYYPGVTGGPGPGFLSYRNATWIPDLDTLAVPGFFPKGFFKQ